MYYIHYVIQEYWQDRSLLTQCTYPIFAEDVSPSICNFRARLGGGGEYLPQIYEKFEETIFGFRTFEKESSDLILHSRYIMDNASIECLAKFKPVSRSRIMLM